ncbi:MAG: 4-hydroxy-tetrahydrodipicolinate reductase [Bacteroidota bacterium]
MNIALIGHGRMGREVESLAREKGLRIAAVFTEENNARGRGLTPASLREAEVCIDFSSPSSAVENIEAAAACGKNIVVGTTGWYDRLEHVRRIVKERGIGLVYAPNFSLGVALFAQVAVDAARLIGSHPEYDAAIHEEHHAGKADSPSGTALSLGALLLQALRRKTEILHETSHGPIQPHQLHVTASRVGHATGTHSIVFDSEADTITLIHTARNRRGFALGALTAAEWVRGKQGCYTMRDVILP